MTADVDVQGPPSLADAQRAGAVLVDGGAARVLLYGSVARGDQHAGSDIDLLAILDDVDYAKRGDVAAHLATRASAAVGRGVEVRVSDWPEWAMRTEKVSSSFEAHIASYALVLEDREPAQVRWDKPMVKPASNLDEASEALGHVAHDLAHKLRWRLERFFERPPQLVERPRAAWEDHTIVGDFCRDGALVVWRAVSVMVGLGGQYPPRLPRHLDFAAFVAAIPPAVRDLCDPWAADVAQIDVGDAESYCGNRWCCFPTLPGRETLEIARTLAAAAARSTGEACEQISRHHSGDTDASTSFGQITGVERDAQEILDLLQRWDPPIDIDAAAAHPRRANPGIGGDA